MQWTHLIATLLAEPVLRLEGSLLGPLVADGLLGLGKVQGWREGAHGYRPRAVRSKMDGRAERARRPDELVKSVGRENLGVQFYFDYFVVSFIRLVKIRPGNELYRSPPGMPVHAYSFLC